MGGALGAIREARVKVIVELVVLVKAMILVLGHRGRHGQ